MNKEEKTKVPNKDQWGWSDTVILLFAVFALASLVFIFYMDYKSIAEAKEICDSELMEYYEETINYAVCIDGDEIRIFNREEYRASLEPITLEPVTINCVVQVGGSDLNTVQIYYSIRIVGE